MTEQTNCYIGTFHNDTDKYTEVAVTGKPEIFEFVKDSYIGNVAFRLNDSYRYEFEDFKNVTQLDASFQKETKDTLIVDQWYWAFIKLCWTPVYLVSINNRFRFKMFGLVGAYSCRCISYFGPRIDLL